MKRVVIAWMEDTPGVLARVAGLFRRRGFNIESLIVGHSETGGISRMTFVVDCDDRTMHQVQTQLDKLVNVTAVQDVTAMPSVVREMALVKVAAKTSEARTEIMRTAEIFRAKIVDVGHSALIVEVTGEEDKVESLIGLFRRLGILELTRTGEVAMVRSSVTENGSESQP